MNQEQEVILEIKNSDKNKKQWVRPQLINIAQIATSENVMEDVSSLGAPQKERLYGDPVQKG